MGVTADFDDSEVRLAEKSSRESLKISGAHQGHGCITHSKAADATIPITRTIKSERAKKYDTFMTLHHVRACLDFERD